MGLKFDLNCKIDPEGAVEVRCFFHRPGGSVVERMMPVDGARFHWVPVYDLVTKEQVGERVVLDEGYVTLHDEGERYLANGMSPLRFMWNSPTPCTGVIEGGRDE